MNTDFQNLAGKSAGEIARDIADFLSLSCVVQGRKEMDLANLLPELNMREQFSFALLMETRTQGWEPSVAESFFRRICTPSVGEETTELMLSAFNHMDSEEFSSYLTRYGANFGLTSHAYWTSCLAVATDAKAIPQLMEYLQGFLCCLLEVAYMNDRNPNETYAWKYYEAFQGILTELTTPPDNPEAVVVRALGGSAGKRDGDGYQLALGIDLQNPNEGHMAWNTKIDVTLKDKDGNIITVIEDQVTCIDPGTIFHYGITRKIRGAAVAHISASAKAGDFLKLSTPIMNRVKVTQASCKKGDSNAQLSGKMISKYDCPLRSFALHYQFLSAENKILGGGCEWFFEEFPAESEKEFLTKCPVPVKNAAKIVYSLDFNALDLMET